MGVILYGWEAVSVELVLYQWVGAVLWRWGGVSLVLVLYQWVGAGLWRWGVSLVLAAPVPVSGRSHMAVRRRKPGTGCSCTSEWAQSYGGEEAYVENKTIILSTYFLCCLLSYRTISWVHTCNNNTVNTIIHSSDFISIPIHQFFPDSRFYVAWKLQQISFKLSLELLNRELRVVLSLNSILGAIDTEVEQNIYLRRGMTLGKCPTISEPGNIQVCCVYRLKFEESNVYFEKHTITKNNQYNHLTASYTPIKDRGRVSVGLSEHL